MWQHLVNIILGLVLILLALVAVGVGTLTSSLAWTFGLIGLVVALFALWGFVEETDIFAPKEPKIEEEEM